MQERLIELQQQRARLLERVAHERQLLAVQVQPVARVLHVGDRLADLFARCQRFALQHPLTVAAVVGTVLVLRPTGTLRWARRGLVAWRSWKALRGSVPTLLSRWL